MKVLLDTHAFLWFVNDDPQLPQRVRDLLEDEQTEVYLSLISAWEIAIKCSIGKLQVPDPVESFVAREALQNDLLLLPLELRHIGQVEVLPLHHHDPFDRLLIAQGIVEGIPVVSIDKKFDAYQVKRLW